MERPLEVHMRNNLYHGYVTREHMTPGRQPLASAKRLSTGVLAAAAVIASLSVASGYGTLAKAEATQPLDRCRALSDLAERLRCFDGPPPPVRGPNVRSESLGTWRLVRTPNRDGG